MRPYLVRIGCTAVVMANDEKHAVDVAMIYRQDIMQQTRDRYMHTAVLAQVQSPLDLSYGWTPESIPFGGDNATTIAGIIAAAEASDKELLSGALVVDRPAHASDGCDSAGHSVNGAAIDAVFGRENPADYGQDVAG